MWDEDPGGDDWEPLRTRRARSIRIIALLIVAALVVALVVPVLFRLLRGPSGNDPGPEEGVRAAVVQEASLATIPA